MSHIKSVWCEKSSALLPLPAIMAALVLTITLTPISGFATSPDTQTYLGTAYGRMRLSVTPSWWDRRRR